MLSLLVTTCMYIRHTAFDFYHARLLENGSKTTAWFVEQIGYALPWILICIFHGIVYLKHDRHDGICQREMFWEVLLVVILTYGVLLPCMVHVSNTMYEAALEIGASIPQTDGKHDVTLAMKLHEWFIRLTIPLGALLVFHSMRARREIRCPETETEEPVMTKAEYDAARRAAHAAQEAAEEAVDTDFSETPDPTDVPPSEVVDRE